MGSRSSKRTHVADTVKDTLNKLCLRADCDYRVNFAGVSGLRLVFCNVRPLILFPLGPWSAPTAVRGRIRAHCSSVTPPGGPPPSAGCPVPKAPPAPGCSSPDPGSAPPMGLEGRLLAYPNTRLTFRNGCSTFDRIDALFRSTNASPRPGSSFRRRPGLIAICQSTSHPRFSSRLWTPRYPASPHTTISPPCNRLCASVTSCALAAVVVKLGATPVPSPPRGAPSSQNATGSPSWSGASPGPAAQSGSSSRTELR